MNDAIVFVGGTNAPQMLAVPSRTLYWHSGFLSAQFRLEEKLQRFLFFCVLRPEQCLNDFAISNLLPLRIEAATS